MKKLLLITAAALVGFGTQAMATLTVTDVASSDLAIQLRKLTKTDWASNIGAGSFTESGVTFTWNNGIDDGPVAINPEDRLVIEAIHKSANFVNEFGVIVDDGLDQTLVTNTNINQSVMVKSDIADTKVFGFAADTSSMNLAKSAGVVPSSNNANIWTYTAGDSSKAQFLWFFEDYAEGVSGRDDDFNDFIVLGTISAVPEPSTIISLIAVGFLGFVTWRNRRKAKA